MTGCDQVHVALKSRLLGDNGSGYVSSDLAEGLQDKGKIERWHQTLKNRILLENDFLPRDLEAEIEAFVCH